MSWLESDLALKLVNIAVWAALLAALRVLSARGLELVPMSEDRKAAVRRLRPMVGLVTLLVFVLLATHEVFSGYGSVLPFALLVVLAGFYAAFRSVIRDIFAGLALRSENSCRMGDHLRVADMEGRVTALGARAITLETSDGDTVVIPYSHAADLPFSHTRGVDRWASQTFSIEYPGEFGFARLGRLVERAALECHWSVVSRTPQVVHRGEGAAEVTVYALAREHALEVESAVRRRVRVAAEEWERAHAPEPAGPSAAANEAQVDSGKIGRA